MTAGNTGKKFMMFCIIFLLLGNGFPIDVLINTFVCAEYIHPGPNEVKIVFSGIDMPLGRIILIKNKNVFCAVKFNNFRSEKDKRVDFENRFADYEVYYQPDGTGDFSKENVRFSIETASLLRPRGPFYPLKWQPGHPAIKCGPLNIAWDHNGFVCFFEQKQPPKDYGIELAPTTWQHISQVNIVDPGIRWYRYDVDRKDMTIPIDNLWNHSNAVR